MLRFILLRNKMKTSLMPFSKMQSFIVSNSNIIIIYDSIVIIIQKFSIILRIPKENWKQKWKINLQDYIFLYKYCLEILQR